MKLRYYVFTFKAIVAAAASAVATVAYTPWCDARPGDPRWRSAHGQGVPVSADAPPRPHPSDQVRALFRTLIKLCHPDLAADDADRLRREEFTARVNAAYAANNAAWLAELAREWQAGPLDAAATAPGQVPELRAAVELARRQLSEVRTEIARLTTTGLGELLFGSEDPHAAVQRIA